MVVVDLFGANLVLVIRRVLLESVSFESGSLSSSRSNSWSLLDSALTIAPRMTFNFSKNTEHFSEEIQNGYVNPTKFE